MRVVNDFRNFNVFLKSIMSPISYSKDWKQSYDLFNGRVYPCFSIGLKYGLSSYHTRSWSIQSKAVYNYIPMAHGKIQIQALNHGFQHCPRCFQNVMYKLVQDMEYVKTYLDDMLILTNSSFKDHLLKLETRNGSSKTLNQWLGGMRVNVLMSPNLSSLQNK
jgi:hypothetical protein